MDTATLHMHPPRASAGHGLRRSRRWRAASALPASSAARPQRAWRRSQPASERILVVLELSGGNDGLNTLVPYGDDAYYRHRPTDRHQAGRAAQDRRPFRLQPGHGRLRAPVQGRQARHRAWLRICQPVVLAFHVDGVLAHGRAQQRRGVRLGRTAGRLRWSRTAPPNFIVNIDATQSLAVRSRQHTPVVFDDPDKFDAQGLLPGEAAVPSHVAEAGGETNPSQRYLLRRRAQRARRLRTGARGLGQLQVAHRLRHRAAGPAEGRGADRGGPADAALLHRVPQQRVRHPRAPGRPASRVCSPMPPTPSPASCGTWSASGAPTTWR